MKIDLYLPERLQQRIDSKRQRLEELEAESTAIGSLAVTDEKVMSSPPGGARFEEVLFRKMVVEKEIQQLLLKKTEVVEEILKVAWQLSFDEQDLIIMRYINLRLITDIADTLSVSYRTVQRRLKTAKQHFHEAEEDVD